MVAGVTSSPSNQLPAKALADVAKLAATDRRVRAHEQAHVAAAGGYVRGGPTYSYTTGPDGKRYAVGGEVNLDTTPVRGDPEATIQKARTLQAAANAPADPSSQDRAVAAAAAAMEQAAYREIEARARLVRTSYGARETGASPSVDVQA
jgi:hypothetical protein